ncbi:MAG: hypothetical protein IPN76_08935 [Saprospiraceae bacterium]|nr:hypothetical protein [Saprospiraceae bacterium]
MLAEEHGLRDKDVAKEFVKWYRRKCELAGENEPHMPEKKGPEPKGDEQSLKEQIRNCKNGWHCRAQVEALETMIDIAEGQRTDIRKSLAPSSRKMKSYYKTVGLAVLCGLFGKSRQAYYEQIWHEERPSSRTRHRGPGRERRIARRWRAQPVPDTEAGAERPRGMSGVTALRGAQENGLLVKRR